MRKPGASHARPSRLSRSGARRAPPGEPLSSPEVLPRPPPAPSTRQGRGVALGAWAGGRRRPRGMAGAGSEPRRHLPDQRAGRSAKQPYAPPDAVNVQTHPVLPQRPVCVLPAADAQLSTASPGSPAPPPRSLPSPPEPLTPRGAPRITQLRHPRPHLGRTLPTLVPEPSSQRRLLPAELQARTDCCHCRRPAAVRAGCTGGEKRRAPHGWASRAAESWNVPALREDMGGLSRTCAPGRSGRVPRLLRCLRASAPARDGLRPGPQRTSSPRCARPRPPVRASRNLGSWLVHVPAFGGHRR